MRLPPKPLCVSAHLRVTVRHQGKDGKTRFTPVGAAFPQKDGSKSAMKIVLNFPVGATEFVLFEPKTDEEDGPIEE